MNPAIVTDEDAENALALALQRLRLRKRAARQLRAEGADPARVAGADVDVQLADDGVIRWTAELMRRRHNH